MTNTMTTAGEEMPPVTDDVSELHAWALIIAGSLVTTLGAVSDDVSSPFAWVSAFWFFLFQVGTSLSARRARNSWIRSEPFTLLVNVGCMGAFGLMAHEGFVQAFTVARAHGLGAGMSPELLWWVLFLVPFLEPAGFWTNAVHKEWRARPAPKARRLPSVQGRNVAEFVQKTAGVAGMLSAGLAPVAANGHAPGPDQNVLGVQIGAAPIVQMADAAAARRMHIAEAHRMHSQGASINAIALQLGKHRNTISGWLRAL